MKETLMSYLTFLILAALSWGVLILVMQRSYIYYPDKTEPSRTLYRAGFMDVISFVTSDGLTLKGWYTAPAPGRPVIVHFHGNGGNIGLRAQVAEHYVQQGYGVLLAEYRGYGGNAGKPNEKGFYRDARAYIDGLVNKMGVSQKEIVLYGESLGTGVAVKMAVEYPDVAALILEAPYTSIAALSQKHMRYFPVYPLIRDRYNSYGRIKSVKAPLLVLHGKRDRIVPFVLGEKLFDHAEEPKRMEVFPDGHHLDLYQHGAALKVIAFLQSLDQVKMSPDDKRTKEK